MKTKSCQCRACSDGRCGVQTDNLNSLTSLSICDPCQEGTHRVRRLDLPFPGPASRRDMEGR